MGRQGGVDLHHAVIVSFELKGLWYGALFRMHIQGPGPGPDLSRGVIPQALFHTLQDVLQLHRRMPQCQIAAHQGCWQTAARHAFHIPHDTVLALQRSLKDLGLCLWKAICCWFPWHAWAPNIHHRISGRVSQTMHTGRIGCRQGTRCSSWSVRKPCQVVSCRLERPPKLLPASARLSGARSPYLCHLPTLCAAQRTGPCCVMRALPWPLATQPRESDG